MGDPKFPSKHYDTPPHPWQKNRIEQESGLMHQYGLKSKREIWKANTKVKEIRRQARRLTAKASEEQAQKEKNLLLNKLERLGFIDNNSALDEVLSMNIETVLDRRLQTQVYLQGLSSTVKQSRQLIIHGHISIDGVVNRIPSMIVTKLKEKKITYSPSSPLNSDLHPVRPNLLNSHDDYNDEDLSSTEKEDEEKKQDEEARKETTPEEKGDKK